MVYIKIIRCAEYCDHGGKFLGGRLAMHGVAVQNFGGFDKDKIASGPYPWSCTSCPLNIPSSSLRSRNLQAASYLRRRTTNIFFVHY